MAVIATNQDCVLAPLPGRTRHGTFKATRHCTGTVLCLGPAGEGRGAGRGLWPRFLALVARRLRCAAWNEAAKQPGNPTERALGPLTGPLWAASPLTAGAWRVGFCALPTETEQLCAE